MAFPQVMRREMRRANTELNFQTKAFLEFQKAPKEWDVTNTSMPSKPSKFSLWDQTSF